MDKYLSFYDATFYNDYIWFSNVNFNGLFKTNMKDYSTEFVTYFPGEIMEQKSMHGKTVVYGECIIFVPMRGKNIHIYNTVNKDMTSLDITKYKKSKRHFSFETILFGSVLYIFPVDSAAIKLDLEKMTIAEVGELSNEYYEYLPNGKNFVIWKAVFDGEKAYFPQYNGNHILVWDVKNDSYEVMEINIHNLFALQKSETGLWLFTGENSKLYLYEQKNGEIKEYFIDTDGIPGEQRYFNRVIEVKSKVYLLPDKGKSILTLNEEGAFFEKAFEYPPEFCFIEDFKYKWEKFFGAKVLDNDIYIYPFRGNQMLMVNTEDNSVTGIGIYADDEVYEEVEKDIYREFLRGKQIIIENRNDNLKKFIWSI